jgi:Leucine-rich repeat (LRR) protein
MSLPQMHGVEMLWIGLVNQSFLEAICAMPNLKGLWIKSTTAHELECLSNAKSLRYLRLGNATKLTEIKTLGRLTQLEWLATENMKKITDLFPIGRLSGLKALAIEGGMWSPQIVETLSPIANLQNLRYLSLLNCRPKDKTLLTLLPLRKLERIDTSLWFRADELATIRARNPNLAP